MTLPIEKAPPPGGEKIQPYADLSDPELAALVAAAADIRTRMALLSPGECAETLISHGMPRRAAYEQVRTPGLRFFAAKFKLDCEDAEKGDPQARARVEYCEEEWARMRRLRGE